MEKKGQSALKRQNDNIFVISTAEQTQLKANGCNPIDGDDKSGNEDCVMTNSQGRQVDACVGVAAVVFADCYICCTSGETKCLNELKNIRNKVQDWLGRLLHREMYYIFIYISIIPYRITYIPEQAKHLPE